MLPPLQDDAFVADEAMLIELLPTFEDNDITAMRKRAAVVATRTKHGELTLAMLLMAGRRCCVMACLWQD